MKPRFSGLPFFVYPVSNMKRAERFYRDVLGLEPGDRWENSWVEYNVGRGVLALCTGMKDAKPGARGGAAALETDQFDEVVALLRRRRVKFLYGPTDTGVCDFARFCDPDGNHLVLHRKHRKPRKPAS